MNLSRRNTVLVLAALGFVSMASGFTLELHLACVEDTDHHDSADCSLCHAILLGAAGFQFDTPSTLACHDDFVETIRETRAVLHRRITLAVLGPRPPPICTA